MKASPDTLGRLYARLLAYALRRFSRPPYGTVFQVEVEGDVADRAACAGLRAAHLDGCRLTAACLLQWADGSLRAPGVHLQALAVDPIRMLRDLERMGARLFARDAGGAVLMVVAASI